MAIRNRTARRRFREFIFAALPVISGVADAGADDVLELMENIVVPASDAIWQADEPLSETSRQKLEKPAKALEEAGKLLSGMGSPYYEEKGSGRQEWQAGAVSMSAAALEILKALSEQDIDGFYDASDKLYNQCVVCHEAFHPDVTD